MAKRDLRPGTQILPRIGKRNDAFQELGNRDIDMEMNLLHQAYITDGLRGDFTISGGPAKNGETESEEQNLTGIQVRKDFSVENETRR